MLTCQMFIIICQLFILTCQMMIFTFRERERERERESEREREREYDIKVNSIIKCMVDPKTGLFISWMNRWDRILIRYSIYRSITQISVLNFVIGGKVSNEVNFSAKHTPSAPLKNRRRYHVYTIEVISRCTSSSVIENQMSCWCEDDSHEAVLGVR